MDSCSSDSEESVDGHVNYVDESSHEDEISSEDDKSSQDQSEEENEDENVCLICLERFSMSNPLMVTKCCKNPFHFKCISKWNKRKKRCPLDCKRPLDLMELKRVYQKHPTRQTKRRKNNHGQATKSSNKFSERKKEATNCKNKQKCAEPPENISKQKQAANDSMNKLKLANPQKQATNDKNKQKCAEPANQSPLAGKSDEELNDLLLKWRKDGLLKPQYVTRWEHGGRSRGSKSRSIMKYMYPLLFDEYPQHPHYNIIGLQVNNNSRFDVEAYHEVMWVEFVELLKDVVGYSSRTQMSTLAAKIVKAEQLRDEIGFNVSVILARLNLIVSNKKGKLETELEEAQKWGSNHT